MRKQKQPDKPAKDPFFFRECFLMPMPIGIKVVNLRELLHALREVSDVGTLLSSAAIPPGRCGCRRWNFPMTSPSGPQYSLQD